MRRHSLIVAIALAATLAPVAHASTPTGRLLVLTDGTAATSDPVATTPQAVAARAGGRLAGHQIPQIGLVTLRPGRGQSTHELVDKLRAEPAVASVTAEHRATKRLAPTDPAFVQPIPGSPPGTTYEWWANKENFPAAWDVTQGRNALVGVIDTGVDVTHPDFAGRIAFDVDQDPRPEDGSVGTDPAGHGTHVASLACAADGNGIGLVGAGLGCRLIVEKSDLSDSSVAASIIDATNKGAQAINMSFGTDGARAGAQADRRRDQLRLRAQRRARRRGGRRAGHRAGRPVERAAAEQHRPEPSPRASGSTSPPPTSPGIAPRSPASAHRSRSPPTAPTARRTAARPGCSARSRPRRRCSTPAPPGRRPSPSATAARASTATSATPSFRARRWPRRRSPRRRRSCVRSTPG